MSRSANVSTSSLASPGGGSGGGGGGGGVPSPVARCSCATLCVAVSLLWRSPPLHRGFIACVALQLLLQLAERCTLLGLGLASADSLTAATRADVWFFLIVLTTSAFAVYNALRALLTVNSAELLVYFATSMLLAARLVVAYVGGSAECSGGGATICIAFLVPALALALAGAALTAAMYTDLRWKRYKAIGAEVGTREMYARWEAFVALRSLDFQNALIIVITGAVFCAGAPAAAAPAALGLALALLAVELGWEVAGDVAARRESRAAMAVFWALSPLTPAYVIWLTIATVTTGGGGPLMEAEVYPVVLITVSARAARATTGGRAAPTASRTYKSPPAPLTLSLPARAGGRV